MNPKPSSCYNCKYRAGLPGSAHSQCEHPDSGLHSADPFHKILAVFASVGRIDPQIGDAASKMVKLDPHGVHHGWCNWPYNFDPVWIDECKGFTPKDQKEKP